MPKNGNKTLRNVGIVIAAIVALMGIVNYAIPDTTAVIERHNDSIYAHPDMRRDIDTLKQENDVLSDTLISIRFQLQAIHEKLDRQDKKLDKILEKIS